MSTAPKSDDPRLGSIITPGLDGDVVLVGFPHDEGTIRNGGRPGAAHSPAVFRSFLPKIGTIVNPERNFLDLSQWVKVSDAGDVAPNAKTLEEAHEALHSVVKQILSRGKIPFVVGGSNDQSSSNGRALLDVLQEQQAADAVVVCNIDAHLDVRPRIAIVPPPQEVTGAAAAEQQQQVAPTLIHSGCPFRDLLNDGRLLPRNFYEFAVQGHQCSAAHVKWLLEEKKVPAQNIRWLGQIQEVEKKQSMSVAQQLSSLLYSPANAAAAAVFLSFDIDSITGADCPGVSCPATIGITAQDAAEICFEAGRQSATKLVDLSEMNCVVEGYRTPRLAVLMFYHFLLGRAERLRSESTEAKHLKLLKVI